MIWVPAFAGMSGWSEVATLTSARINDLNLYYERSGSGPPLLFISGTGGDLRVQPNVFASSLDKAFDLASRMDTGTVWINKHAELAPNIPFGGSKLSGIGTELGHEGLAEFTQIHVINMAKR